MRFRSNRPQVQNTVLLTVWLFADLFLGLAIIFLSTNISGIKLPATPTPTPIPVVIPTPTPLSIPTLVPTATPVPLPRLEFTKHRITLTNIDTNGLLNGTQGAIDDLKRQVRGQNFLQGRSVGLVIAYGGAVDTGQIGTAQSIADKVMDALRSLGHDGFAFQRASYYDHLYRLGDPSTTVTIDIYLFV